MRKMVWLILLATLVAGMSGCPQLPQPPVIERTFDYQATITQEVDGTWTALAVVRNPEAGKVSFTLMKFVNGQYFPVGAQYTQRHGVFQNVTMLEVDVDYQNYPVYWWDGYYYSYYQGRCTPVPYNWIVDYRPHVVGAEVTFNTIEIIYADENELLFANFGGLIEGQYMIRITGQTNDNPPAAYRMVEHVLPLITTQPDDGDSDGDGEGNLRMSILTKEPDSQGRILIQLFDYDEARDGDKDLFFFNLVNVATDFGYYHYRWFLKLDTKLGAENVVDSNGIIEVWTDQGGLDSKAVGYCAFTGYLTKPNCGSDGCLGQSPITYESLPDVTGSPRLWDFVERTGQTAKATIDITYDPLYGTNEQNVEGSTTGDTAGLVVLLLGKLNGLWAPTQDGLISINPDGSWEGTIAPKTTGLFALLVPEDIELPAYAKAANANVEDIPLVDPAKVVAFDYVNRVPWIALEYYPPFGAGGPIYVKFSENAYRYRLYAFHGRKIDGLEQLWAKPTYQSPYLTIQEGQTTSTEDYRIEPVDYQVNLLLYGLVVPGTEVPLCGDGPGCVSCTGVESVVDVYVTYVLVNRATELDEIAPIIHLLGDNPQTVEGGPGDYVDPGYTMIDDTDGDISDQVVVTGHVNKMVVGTYELVYSGEDATGNPAASVTRTVHVVDTTGPVITILGNNPDEVLRGSGEYPHAGANAFDAVEGDVSGRIHYVSNVNTGIPGVYHITYTCDDSRGNQAVPVVRTVNVVLAPDSIKPVITLVGPAEVQHQVGTLYQDSGATALDNPGAIDLTAEIESTSTVNPNVFGTYTVTFNVSDAAGNHAVPKVRTVHVLDLVPPGIEGLPSQPPAMYQYGHFQLDLAGAGTDNWFSPSELVWSATCDPTKMDVAVVGNLLTMTTHAWFGTTTVTLRLTQPGGLFVEWVVTVVVMECGGPTLSYIEPIPPIGDMETPLRGIVGCVADPTQYATVTYIYVPGYGWVIKPNFGSDALSLVNPDGTWGCPIRTGGADQTATRVVTFLVPANIPLANIPMLDGAAQEPIKEDIPGSIIKISSNRS